MYKKKMWEIVFTVFLFLLSIAIFFYSGGFPRGFPHPSQYPSFWPRIIASFIMFSTAIMSVSNIIEIRKIKNTGDKPGTKKKDQQKTWKVFMALVIMFFYIYLTKFIGFHIMTILLIIGLSFLIYDEFNLKTFGKTIILAVVVVGLMTYFFGNLLNAKLEPGLLRMFF